MKKFNLICFLLIFIFFSKFSATNVLAYECNYDDICDSNIFGKMMDCTNNMAVKCANLGCACSDTASCNLCDLEFKKCNAEHHKIYDNYEKCSEERDRLIASPGLNKGDCAEIFDSFRSCIENIIGPCSIPSWNCDSGGSFNNGDTGNIISGDNNGNPKKGLNNNDLNDNINDNLIGLPINLGNSISPCIGATPKNSELCPGDDEEVFYYTEKHLTDVCSIPKGSEPKCEYVCKTEQMDDGTCKEEGFFRKILNWLGGLF